MKIAFPHLGDTYIALKGLLDDLGVEYVIAPHQEPEALELGERHTPEAACLPLKIMVGQLIFCHRAGADTVLMIGGKGPCRLGYYSEMQSQLLREAGYPMDMLVLGPPFTLGALHRKLNELIGPVSWGKLVGTLRAGLRNMRALDALEALGAYTRPRERVSGSTDKIYGEFKKRVLESEGSKEISRMIRKTALRLKGLPVRKAFKPLKVAMVGEIYTSIDPCPTMDLRRQLGRLGLEVHRPLTVSYWMKSFWPEAWHGRAHPLNLAKPYIPSMIGGHARETIGHAIQAAQAGFDGIIQVYPLGCMPEIVTQSILPRIEEDFSIPVLTLVIDSLSGQTGYQTRIEAFIDLLESNSNVRSKKLQ